MPIKKKLAEISEFLAGDETHLKEVLHPKNDNINLGFSLAHAVIKMGQSSLPHQLMHSETYYFLSGKGQMFVGKEIFEVEKGDTVYVPPKTDQSVKNTGEEELVFLCIVSPPWSEDTEDIF